MQNTRLRQRTFIDRQVQGALVRRLVIHWCAFISLGMALALVLEFLHNPELSLPEHVSNVISRNGVFVLATLCLTPVFFYDSIKLSHRFAGPILRLRRQMAQLSRGEEVTIMATRPNDYWQDVILDFNAVVKRVGTLSRSEHADGTSQETAT